MEDCIGKVNLAEFGADVAVAMAEVVGEDNYYIGRVQNGNAIAAQEAQIARYIHDTFPKDIRIAEVGCGFGQLCMLLGALNFKSVTGIEGDAPRFTGSLHMLKHITEEGRWSTLGVQFLGGYYPTDFKPEVDVLCAFNVVNSFWATWPIPEEEKFKTALSQDNCIIDVRLWGVVRETPAEHTALIDTICKDAGFAQVTRIETSTLWHFSR